MALGKKVTIFNWEWGRNSASRDGQKIPCAFIADLALHLKMFLSWGYSLLS